MLKINLIEITNTSSDSALFIGDNFIISSDDDNPVDLEFIANNLSKSLNLPIINIKTTTKDFSEHPEDWNYNELTNWLSRKSNKTTTK